ncbi:MAG: uncharacterized membrane protein YqaE (UPF0057 family) [Crocinitomix sp.]|jgi:uncharacterized membrane protein YqaE (UPF0057 family)
MVKKIHISIVSILMIGLMFSCSTSNDVASNRGIQKRKYNKGFYVEKGPKMGGDTRKVELVENDFSTVESPVAVDKPIERVSSTPEVIYVEEVEEIVAEITPEVVRDNDVEEIAKQAPDSDLAQQNFTVEKEEVLAPSQKLDKRSKKFVEKDFLKRDKQQLKSGDNTILYYILAILLPPLAVGLVTDWDVLLVVISVLLWLFFILPGIIHAIIVVKNNT